MLSDDVILKSYFSWLFVYLFLLQSLVRTGTEGQSNIPQGMVKMVVLCQLWYFTTLKKNFSSVQALFICKTHDPEVKVLQIFSKIAGST